MCKTFRKSQKKIGFCSCVYGFISIRYDFSPERINRYNTIENYNDLELKTLLSYFSRKVANHKNASDIRICFII